MSDLEQRIVSPARRSDPATAHEAAAMSERHTQRSCVFDFLKKCGDHGATDYETGAALGILRTSAGKRRKELCEAGVVASTSDRRLTDTHTKAIVWVVPPGSRDVLYEDLFAVKGEEKQASFDFGG